MTTSALREAEDRNDVLFREYISFANSFMWESARKRIAQITIPAVRAALLRDHDARLELMGLPSAERAAGLQALEEALYVEIVA